MFAVLLVVPEPACAGITNYLPSLSYLNPFYWTSGWSRKSPTQVASNNSSNISNRSDLVNTLEFQPLNSSSSAKTLEKDFKSQSVNKTVGPTTKNATSAQSAPDFRSNGTPNYEPGSLRGLFMTKPPIIVDKSLLSSDHPRKITVIRNGKAYETPIRLSSNSRSGSERQNVSILIDSEEKRPQPKNLN